MKKFIRTNKKSTNQRTNEKEMLSDLNKDAYVSIQR